MDGLHTFQLQVVTPDREFFDGQVQSLVMPALDGQYGIQAGHEAMVTAIEPGKLSFLDQEGTWHEAVVSQGLAEVMPDYVILLVEAAERPEEIDRKRAELAKARAEERLRQKQSIQEYYRSKAALARAMARLKVKR